MAKIMLSETHKRNIALARRGHHASEETKKKMSRSHQGFHHSEETVAKLREFRHSEETRARLRKPKSEEWKKKIGLAHTGKPHPHRGRSISEKERENLRLRMTGKPLSEEIKAKMRKPKCEEHKQHLKIWWANLSPEEKRVIVQNQRRGLMISPNKGEQKVRSILDAFFPGEYKFVGDFSVVIDGKSPDFININGKKKIIEFYGDYWHRNEDPSGRIDLFKQYGYDTLIIWEKELKDLPKLHEKVSEFHIQ